MGPSNQAQDKYSEHLNVINSELGWIVITGNLPMTNNIMSVLAV